MIKIIFIGDRGVRKTAVAQSMTSGCTGDESTGVSIGACHFSKVVSISDDDNVEVQFFDTAGQDLHKQDFGLSPMYFRGAEGVFMVYETSSRESFEVLKSEALLKEIREQCESNVQVMLMGIISSDDTRLVSSEEGRRFAIDNDFLFMEVSPETREGIEDALKELVEAVLRHRPNETSDVANESRCAKPSGIKSWFRRTFGKK